MKKQTPVPARGASKRRKDAPAARKAAAGPRPAPAKGNVGAKVKADDKATIRRLRKELAQAEKRIEELQASADTDFLLGIPNRRGFERELHRSIAYIKRYDASGALIVLDVDRLKPINDAFGHAAGDHVLQTIVATVTRQVRASDVFGRLGGDEFALLVWNLSETDARAKAAALEQLIDQLRFVFDGRTVTAGASTGVAVLTPQVDVARALEEADAAMYLRKALRRHETEPGSAAKAR